MKCPDCGSEMRKQGVFYTCSRCGLSLKAWEIEKARIRAKREIEELKENDPEADIERRKKERKRYRNWYEGRKED